MKIEYGFIFAFMLLFILVSIQYTLNKMFILLKDIKEILLLRKEGKRHDDFN